MTYEVELHPVAAGAESARTWASADPAHRGRSPACAPYLPS